MDKINYLKYHRDGDYEKFESLFRNIFRKRFNIVKRFVKKPGRILDIGASTGVMLDIFKENAWETWGVEPSESAHSAKRKGHRVVNNYFEEANLPKNYFDLVIINHTLEHLDDPVLVLKKTGKFLRKNGILLVDVPNAGGLGARMLGKRWPYRLPAEHKHQFTRESLTNVFEKTGFKVIHFESRSGIFEFANPLREIFESLFGLKKRFFTNILLFPYSLIATLLNIGDSMSLVGKR